MWHHVKGPNWVCQRQVECPHASLEASQCMTFSFRGLGRSGSARIRSGMVQPTENRRGLDAVTGGKLVPVDVFKETKSQEPLPRGVHPSVQLAKIYYPPPTSGRITLGICFEVEPVLARS